MKKFLAALVMAAVVLLAAASVSWGNEPSTEGTWEGGTWEGLDAVGVWE